MTANSQRNDNIPGSNSICECLSHLTTNETLRYIPYKLFMQNVRRFYLNATLLRPFEWYKRKTTREKSFWTNYSSSVKSFSPFDVCDADLFAISIFQSILNKARSTISFYSRSITRKCIDVMRLEQISIIDWNHLRLSNNVIDFNLIRLHISVLCCSPIYLWENNQKTLRSIDLKPTANLIIIFLNSFSCWLSYCCCYELCSVPSVLFCRK